MTARVLHQGQYQIGGNSLIQNSVLGTAATAGQLALGPMNLIGFYDLKPWQDQPFIPGRDEWRSWTTAVPSGEARIRFSMLMQPSLAGAGQPPGPGARVPMALQLAVQSGSKTSRIGQTVWNNQVDPTFIPGVPSADTAIATSLFISAFDFPPVTQTWQTPNGNLLGASLPDDWQWMDLQQLALPPNQQNIWNHMTVGPEILSDLAQGNGATYDLGVLSGGCRFVGVFMACYGAGNLITTAGPIGELHYTVEDQCAPGQYGGSTFAYPIRAIQEDNGATTLDDDNTWSVAQWGLQRLGGAPYFAGANAGAGVNCSVNIVNNNDFTLLGEIKYFIGPSLDTTASPGTAASAQVITAGTPATQEPGWFRMPPDNGLPAGSVQGPYSYAHLQLKAPIATVPAATGTTAIAYVTVS